MLTHRRFKALTESYGAELQRWPEEVRGEARVLVNTSARARRILAEARALDEALEATRIREDEKLWPPGERNAALARVRAGVASRLSSAPLRGRRFFGHELPRGSGWAIIGSLGWVGLLAGSFVAIAAGLMIGSFYAPSQAPIDVLAMLQPAPINIFSN
ncbi:MAG TPA: hypothetical protein VMA37_12530 [Acetobacteraceae bacterium]|nr:hypothetical protein [Acetobacteraceae bacterium]